MNTNFFVRKSALVIYLLMSAGYCMLWSQSASTLSEGGLKAHALFELNTAWHTAAGELLNLPFIRPVSEAPLAVTYQWTWDCQLPDTVYVYIEGLAWEADLTLNDQFLSISSSPLTPWVIPIAREWLGNSPANFTLTLRAGNAYPNFPRPFLGITHGVYIMDSAQLAHTQRKLLPHNSLADSVICWAPYFDGSIVYHDSIAFQHLWHILKQPINTIYFPFPPSRRQLRLCAHYDLRIADQINQDTYVAMLNDYPLDERALTLHKRFWLDTHQRRLKDYEEYFPASLPMTYSKTVKPWLGMGVIIFFPLLALLLIKLTNNNFFYSLHRLFLKPDIFIDTINDITSGNPGFIILLILIKIFTYTFLITVGIYYVDWANLWEEMNVLSEQSLLFRIFYGINRTGKIFVRALLIVSTWQVFKYSLLNLTGTIFNIRNFSLLGFNLDMVGILPYMMALKIPLIVVLFLQEGYILLGILFITGLLFFFLRQIYVLYLGLERVFNFSLGVKILYICAFKLLPYIIWL